MWRGLIVAVCFFCVRESEPSYNGRTLSEWIDEEQRMDFYRQYEQGAPPSVTHQQVQSAVRAIGTNALPLLLQWLRATNSSWKTTLARKTQTWPRWIQDNSALRELTESDAPQKHVRARMGFQLLGTNALPALPQLLRIFKSSTNPDEMYSAVATMTVLGADTIPPLLNVLESGADVSHREYAIISLGAMSNVGTNAASAIPVLLKIARDSHSPHALAIAATRAVTSLGICPEQVVPFLISRMNSTNSTIRRDTVRLFGEQKRFVRPALPALQRCLRDPDRDVRESATNVIIEFAPEVLTNDVNFIQEQRGRAHMAFNGFVKRIPFLFMKIPSHCLQGQREVGLISRHSWCGSARLVTSSPTRVNCRSLSPKRRV